MPRMRKKNLERAYTSKSAVVFIEGGAVQKVLGAVDIIDMDNIKAGDTPDKATLALIHKHYDKDFNPETDIEGRA